MDKLYGGEDYWPQTGIQIFVDLALKFVYPTLVDRTDDGKEYACFDLVLPENDKEVSFTASGKFSVEEGTFYATVESPFTPGDPVGDLIALLSSNWLPSPSSRLAQDPLEEMCLIYLCNRHTPTYGITFPLAFPCINNKHPPALDTLATLENFRNCHFDYSLGNQRSFCISDQLPTEHSLVNLCVPSLEDIEEEIIFYYSDDEGYENEDVLMEIGLCMPFGAQLFPHHNDDYPWQYLCELVPSSRKMIFIDGEPLPVTTGEPYVEEESVAGEQACFRDPKCTITGSAGSNLDTYGLNQDPALIALSTSTCDGVQTFLENLAAGYAQDVNPQVLPDPPSYVSLLPSDSISESTMAVLKDETQACGIKYIWPHVLAKVGSYTQDFHHLKIFYAAKSIALLYIVYGILTPLPFDRGKMNYSLSPPCHHAGSFAHPIKPLLSKLGAFIPTHIKSIGRSSVSCDLVLPMGSDNKLMGSDNMHKLYLSQALAKQNDLLHSDPLWIWITQESHILFSTKFKSSYLEVYILLDGLPFLLLA